MLSDHFNLPKVTMKMTIFFAVVSVAVMVVMVGQVVRQELSKNAVRALAQDRATEISNKERTIADLKIALQGLRPRLLSVTKLTEELKAKKEAIMNERKSTQDEIIKCKEEKGRAEKKKADAIENSNKVKSDHDQAKQAAQKTIQDLKQKNLDREKTICALVDTTIAEARKLCGLPA